uniref:N-alpha-acetyltransferase 60 n=1 Tax=Timema poppense TaxID=170557 RepID=A0A7R9H6V0_TIMPO|nr:unnamed protein product [Timema poppensis]
MAGINWYAGYQINKSCMTKPVPLCGLSNLQLRFLCPTDLEELRLRQAGMLVVDWPLTSPRPKGPDTDSVSVGPWSVLLAHKKFYSQVRTLCQDWFPIDYPYSWYEDITSNPRFYSLAAVYNGIIIGLIVAEIKSYFKLNREVRCRNDRGILSQAFNKQTELGYILSLGVSKEQRRNGIASLLLDNLIAHLTTVDHVDCKALFLHVLTTNSAAIHFYEHRNFRLHSFLPYYYSIKGKCKDGFTYVLYINGGHPPWGLYDYLKHYCGVLYQADLCSVPSWMWHKMQAVLHWVWPGMRRIVVQNTTAVFSYCS